MPSLLHEGVVMLFRDRPSLAPELLRDALGLALPEGDVIDRCRDLATLEVWITRAATADSARAALGL